MDEFFEQIPVVIMSHIIGSALLGIFGGWLCERFGMREAKIADTLLAVIILFNAALAITIDARVVYLAGMRDGANPGELSRAQEEIQRLRNIAAGAGKYIPDANSSEEIRLLQVENNALHKRAAEADDYEKWLREIARSVGCGHIDDALPGCVDRAVNAPRSRDTAARDSDAP